MKFNELGRSMVEMLGVLAIIGVLSVGAIAGYSKAMMKYKLNKQAEQLNSFINDSLVYASQFSLPVPGSDDPYPYATSSLIPYYIKLGIVPENMIKNDQIYDIFNNPISSIYYNLYSSKYSYIETNISIQNKGDKESVMNQCINILNIAKENKENIYMVFSQSFGSNSPSSYQMIYGDTSCTANRICFKYLNLKQMENFCSNCVNVENILFCNIGIQYNYQTY